MAARAERAADISSTRAWARCRSRHSARSPIMRRSDAAVAAAARRSGGVPAHPLHEPRVRALADAVSAGISPLPDPDPPLNALEQQGKLVFQRACAHCHGGPVNRRRRRRSRRSVSRHRSQCPRRSIPWCPARFDFAPVPAAAGAQRPDLRDHAPNGHRPSAPVPIPAARC